MSGRGSAWMNGEYLPLDRARIPVTDAGLTRSDATYDVVGVWDGRFFRLDDHLDRFLRGSEALRLRPPVGRDELRAALIGCVARSGLREAYVQMVLTRGVSAGGDRDPRRMRPNLWAYAVPYIWIVPPHEQERGVDVVVARNTRRIPPDSVDPTVKNFHWGDLTRGLFEAYDRDATLAVLTDGAGLVTEGPGFNVAALVDGVLRTPADGVLHGITRRTVLEIADRAGIPVSVGELPVAELARAEEVLLTSTAGGVMPVARLDGRALRSAAADSVTRRIRDEYWRLHTDPALTVEVTYDAR